MITVSPRAGARVIRGACVTRDHLVGRSADVADWLADMVGATVGIWAGLLAARLLRSFLLSGAQKTQ